MTSRGPTSGLGAQSDAALGEPAGSRRAGTPRLPRVVIADDSRLMRAILSRGLQDLGFEVVGAGADGDEALALCSALKPDVLTLDLAMPGRDGIGVLKALQGSSHPVSVVVVSAFSPAHGARAVDALAEGAVELVPKPPAGADVGAFIAELADKIVGAARSRRSPARVVRTRKPIAAARPSRAGTKVVLIATSTGGPRALAEVVPHLPARVGQGVLIVQHMPPGFTGSLAERLDRSAQLTVREARTGDSLEPGLALMAPGGSHLRIGVGGALSLSDEAAVGGLRPRADLTIVDAAKAFGSRLLLVVLTGMGRDGLDGARAVRDAGGRVIVESESTCTVYGMPRAVEEAGLADRVLPLGDVPAAIVGEAA